MSPERLVHAYAEGRMSRRTLIRRLAAAGVSFGAAVSYAHLLGQERAAGGEVDHYHPPLPVEGRILAQPLAQVIEEERVKVRLEVTKRARVEFQIWVRRPDHVHPYSLIGEREMRTEGPLSKTVNVPLQVNPPHSVNALRPLSVARLELLTIARRSHDPDRDRKAIFGANFDKRRLFA
jgi:hypothetical protein